MARVQLALGRPQCQPGRGHDTRRPPHERRAAPPRPIRSIRAWEVSSTDTRKQKILGAIVEDYVSTREPVGSKSLLERHELGVSAATVRNDMSALEDEGLIIQPHTSAGRIPTEKGYRAFVDSLTAIKPLSAPERRAIESFLAQAGDVEDLLERTVRILAQLTHQVAILQYPLRRQTTVRHIELVRMGDAHLLLVLITEAGRVDQRTVALTDPREPAFYETLRERLHAATAGGKVTELELPLQHLVAATPPADQEAVAEVVRALIGMLDERRAEKVVMAGASHLARAAALPARDLQAGDLDPMLDAIEEQLVLLRLLQDMDLEPGAVEVRIGQEIRGASWQHAALVGSGYDTGSHLAILGPSRMDYLTSISSVQAVARYVARCLR